LTAALRVADIEKRYGHVQALRGVSLHVDYGEVVALLGDNGAGKSTLIKCISGVEQPDAGGIQLDEKAIHLRSAAEARDHGIETVYQDLALAPHLDPASNLFLGRERVRSGWLGRLGFLDDRAMRRATVEALGEMAVELPHPEAQVRLLSGGQRQAVAIVRAAHWAARLVLLDEPTAALGVRQSGRVVELIQRIRSQRLGVLLVSHNLPQVFEVADRIVVLTLGRVALDVAAADTDTETIVSAMVGGTSTAHREPVEAPSGTGPAPAA
jgi:simple sugar transport system ATP-binding protein